MGDSLHIFDNEIADWVRTHIPKTARILDVGPGLGKYGILLRPSHPKIDAIEVFRPYVEKYGLVNIYETVVIGDVTKAPGIEDYDLVIFGDVLEHLGVEEAKAVLAKCKKAIVVVPFMYEQGAINDNPNEVHKQPDLNESVMAQRYPNLKQMFGGPSGGICVYGLNCEFAPQGYKPTRDYKETGKLGLVLQAVNLPKERERFMRSFLDLGEITRKVEVFMVTEKEYGDHDPAAYSPNRARNIGLRALIEPCDGIVLFDADYLMPPGLLDLLFEKTMRNFHVWIRRRDVEECEIAHHDWQGWLRRKVFADCWGSCNFMSRENWLKVGGCDERAYGWGGDDDLLHIRVGKCSIKRRTIDAFPLVHVAHSPRTFTWPNNRGEENMKLALTDQPNFLV